MIEIEFHEMRVPGTILDGLVQQSVKRKLIKTKFYKYKWLASLAKWWWELGSSSPLSPTWTKYHRTLVVCYCKEVD